jgi:hypothetical protein
MLHYFYCDVFSLFFFHCGSASGFQISNFPDFRWSSVPTFGFIIGVCATEHS